VCIAAWGWHARSEWPLIIAANRDEFHEREAEPLMRWDDGSGVIAGRDVRSGGTWFGLSEDTGRVALITNFRDPAGFDPNAPSRGALVTDWLTANWRQPEDRRDGFARYNGFSLLLVDRNDAWVIDNRTIGTQQALDGGYRGLSNGPFDSPWPKTRRLVRALSQAYPIEPEPLLSILETHGPRQEPDGADAPVFIRDPVYGTRCSTVLAVSADGTGFIVERRFDSGGERMGETQLDFRLCP